MQLRPVAFFPGSLISRISFLTIATALAWISPTPARAGDRTIVVRPAIRINVSPGSTPTARLVQYGYYNGYSSGGYYSGPWGSWNGSYSGWGGAGWGGYGGWAAFGGLPGSYAGCGTYAPVYGTYYGGYVNYGYPTLGYSYPGYGYLVNNAFAPYAYSPYSYGYGYPGYGYGYGYGYGGCGYGGGYGGGYYGLGYRIW